MSKNIVVDFQRISKKYTLHHWKPTLIDSIRSGWDETFWALKNVTFQVRKGEKLGLVGSNGSGKTTLLKIISGITRQTSGTARVTGRVVSLIELDAGFHPDLTGRENIFLNGLLIGMTRREIEKKLSEIISFSGLEHFIDSPVYTYSSGMSLRLGFSVAIHADPDILVLDEGISVGDEIFRQKAQKKIENFFQQEKTIIVASHWMDFLAEICTKFVWLEKGKIKKVGGVGILHQYKKDAH